MSIPWKQLKAIMFDLDDTIISFDSATEKAWNHICNEYVSLYHCPFTAQEMKRRISNVRKVYWSDPVRHKRGRENLKMARREVMQLALSQLSGYNEERANVTADRYTALQEELLTLFDGAYEALVNIRKMGYRTALITNGNAEVQRRKLDRFHLESLFDEILIDTEVGVSKPEPEIYRIALERLQIPAFQTLMIGDKPQWDTVPPRTLGIKTVWNDYKHMLQEMPDDLVLGSETDFADLTVTSVAQLARILAHETSGRIL